MQATQSRPSVATPVIGIVVGVILVTIGQFFLDKLADTSDTWHYIQHGVLFVGGLAAGAGIALLYVRGQQRV
jgi:hypothetical protein